jgi:4-diphosphocytidyl-2-C-methyl-D-erythritol kinase
MDQYPSLRAIKDQLYHAGALFASMSGSGSSFFGIFEKGFQLSPTFTRDYPVILLT